MSYEPFQIQKFHGSMFNSGCLLIICCLRLLWRFVLDGHTGHWNIGGIPHSKFKCLVKCLRFL